MAATCWIIGFFDVNVSVDENLGRLNLWSIMMMLTRNFMRLKDWSGRRISSWKNLTQKCWDLAWWFDPFWSTGLLKKSYSLERNKWSPFGWWKLLILKIWSSPDFSSTTTMWLNNWAWTCILCFQSEKISLLGFYHTFDWLIVWHKNWKKNRNFEGFLENKLTEFVDSQRLELIAAMLILIVLLCQLKTGKLTH